MDIRFLKSVREHFSSRDINVCLLLQLLIYSSFVRLLQCGLFYYFLYVLLHCAYHHNTRVPYGSALNN